jgi:hypothetical protein
MRDLERDLDDEAEDIDELDDSAQVASAADSTRTKLDAPDDERDQSS